MQATTMSGVEGGLDARQLEHFRIRRAMIVHEDHQINHRVLTTVTTESLLFTAAAVAVTSGMRDTHPLRVLAFVTLLAVCGISFAALMCMAIYAARCEQSRVRGDHRREAEHTNCQSYCTAFPLPDEAEICLQACGPSVFARGHRYSWLLCLGAVGIWLTLIVLMLLGVV